MLYLLDLLFHGEGIDKEDVQGRFSLSEASFIRYIAEIRAFLMENHPELELHYLKRERRYKIVEVGFRS